VAKSCNWPNFKIINDERLVSLVITQPNSIKEILAQRWLVGFVGRQYATSLLEALQRGAKAPLPQRPHRHHMPDTHTLRTHERLKQWRKARAEHRGVESDIILSKEALWQLASVRPRTWQELEAIGPIGPWRRSEYGQELLSLLTEEAR